MTSTTGTAYRELIEVLGEDGLIALAESFGGTRLYVPTKVTEDHDLVAALGVEGARQFCDRFAPDVIRVPLARTLRATRLRASGLSNARVAVKLGITESAVNRIFKRLADCGENVRP